MTQKQYFKGLIDQAQTTIWEEEFKRYASSELREEVRQEYDNHKSKLSIIEAQIKGLPEDRIQWTDEQKRFEDTKVILDRDIARATDRMEKLDININGCSPTNDYPEGIEGINRRIDALHARVEMLKDYIKTL